MYCQNKPQSEELRRQVGDNNVFFKECQRRLNHKLPLGAYLLKPVQRITKYQLLLKVSFSVFFHWIFFFKFIINLLTSNFIEMYIRDNTIQYNSIKEM